MRILAFAGFLGSGKTTLIRRCIDAMLRQGDRVAIIENEIGATSIDDKLLRDAKIEMTTLRGGCVCCSISGSLVLAADRIEREIAPDWLIVELTGMAYSSGVRGLFTGQEERFRISFVSVIDITRWFRLLNVSRPLLIDQVEGADAVVVNKVDLAQPTEAQLAQITELSGGAAILLSPTPDVDIWERLRPILERDAGGPGAQGKEQAI